MANIDTIDTLKRARELLARARTYVTDTGAILSALEHAWRAAVRDDDDNADAWGQAYACAVSMMARAIDPASGPLADVTGYLIVAEYDHAPSKCADVLDLFDLAIEYLDRAVS
jgi:hypothetical protein